RGSLLAIGEDAGALHHDVDAKLFPRQFFRVPFGQHLDRPRTDVQRVSLYFDAAGKAAVYGIVFQQVRIVLGGEEVVDCDDLQVRALGLYHCPQHIAADSAKTRDCDFQDHGDAPLPANATIWASSAVSQLPLSMRPISATEQRYLLHCVASPQRLLTVPPTQP